jgi:phage-related baseplate assembly protein
MSRFVSANLDLSLLPAPKLAPVDYEAEKAARLAALKARYEAAGIPWDVGGLESDPGVILQEEDAYRHTLDIQAANDLALGRMVAFAQGPDLDQLGALVGVRRFVLDPGDPAASPPRPPVLEGNEAYRRRIQEAPEAFPYAGLTGGAYRHIAREAAGGTLLDVRTIKRRNAQGHPVIDVILLGRDGDGTVPAAVVTAVAQAFEDDEATQLTDIVTVRSAKIVPFAISVRASVPLGPDRELIRAQGVQGLVQMATDLRKIGAIVPIDAVIAAARSRPMTKLDVLSPTADVDPGPDGAAWCTGIAFDVKVAK